MSFNLENPIIVQGDKTLLVEVNNVLYTEVRDKIGRFAEIIKSPEYIHTYKITPLSLWNVASCGMRFEEIIQVLEENSKYDIPQNVIKDIEDNISKYGKIKIIRKYEDLVITSDDEYVMKEVTSYKSLSKYFKEKINQKSYKIYENTKGEIKLSLIKLGFPVEDLDGYIEADIDELNRIAELKIRTDYIGNYYNCREVILKYLKEMPIDRWVEIEQLFKFIKKLDRSFLTNEVGTIYTYNEYERYYYRNSNYWEDESGRYIEVVFIEYLSSIGIVDLLINEYWDDYGVKSYYRIDYVKLTPLGAHILGVNNEYKINKVKDEAGIIIQPNYEIMVPEGAKKEVHCIYLDKFAEKISEDTVSIYKISFKSMVMALDNGMFIEGIIEYLIKNSHNEIPQNVLISLKQWEEESKKVIIRTVTIVERDDKYLLEELKSYKTIEKDMVNELPYAFEINSKAINKVKRNIEKKNHFCIIER